MCRSRHVATVTGHTDWLQGIFYYLPIQYFIPKLFFYSLVANQCGRSQWPRGVTGTYKNFSIKPTS